VATGISSERAAASARHRRDPSGRVWQNLWVRLAVVLAFADASIVVLALPQIVARLHTSISHVTWVIMAYNLALIVAAGAIVPFARRLASRDALVAGLALFGLASIGCGAADSMTALVALRVVQGLGGGLLLCASLPVFAGSARPGESSLIGWSAAAAIGMAVGPAAGGLLTQVFDWRSIFLAQAPVAAVAAVAVLAVGATPKETLEEADSVQSALDPLTANAALLLLSAGLIGALFLSVVVLINVWLLTPIATAAIVTTLPVATGIAQRALRKRSPIVLGTIGAVVLAVGLIGLAFVSHRQVGWAIVTLALCGTGLGLSFTALTAAALGGAGSSTARAAKTVAARDAGIIVGLLVLTPVFVNQLNQAPQRALPAATRAVLTAPMPLRLKAELAPGLIAAYNKAAQSELPDFAPVFARVSANASPADKRHLATLKNRLDSIVQGAATHAFKRPLLYGALFSLAVVPLLMLRLAYERRRKAGDSHPPNPG
jgi:MFS family permease